MIRLALPDPRLRAGVTHEAWDPWTSNASPLHPGWYGDPYDWASSAIAGYYGGSGAAMRVSVVNRCVSLIANMVASLPCLLYRQVGARKERAREHPAYRAVRRRPNAWQTRSQFFRDMQANVSLGGIAYAEIEETPDRLVMNPLNAGRVTVKQLDSGRLRFEYLDPKTQERRTILQERMLYIRDLSTDFYTGMARAALAREAIAVASAAEQFVRRFFVNDAGGRLVFKHPGKFESPDKRNEFENELRRSVMGAINAHRPFFAWGGMEVDELAKASERDFIVDPRKFQAADIARFWGVPGFLIGLEEKSTSWGTGIAEQKQGFVDFTIKPETINWAESLAMTLLDDDEQEDFFFEFEFGALLQANPVQQAEAFDKYKGMGVFSANEIRAKLNENPREGGDEYQDSAPGAAPNPGAVRAPEVVDEDEEAAVVPSPLLADAAERIAKATGRGGKEKWAAYTRKTLAPLGEAYNVMTDPATDRICEAVAGKVATARRDAVLAILYETFTPAKAA